MRTLIFKSTTLIFTVVIAFYVTPLHAQQPQGVNLAEMQDWNIVIADDAIASEVYAAEEFQEFFRQASGLKLPIVHKITRWDKHVFIGPGKVMHASPAGFSVEDLGPEDLHIVVRDNNIAIAGGRPRGTLYGVYTFLEDYLDVRFLTHDHTHVPAVDQQQLIGPLDRIYRPPFANYRNAIDRTTLKHPVFAVRNRNNASHDVPRFGGTSPFININHSFYRQVPYEKYGKEHPKYFGLWDGKRMNSFVHTHLCLTNTDLLPIVTDAVLNLIESPAAVGRKNFSVSQNDTISQYCQCEKCAAIDSPEGSHMGALLEFVNKVADEVAKKHPDVLVGTQAYGFSRKPPKTIKPRPNVQINLVTMGICHIHPITDPNCPRNAEFMREMTKWIRISQHLSIWDYSFSADDLLPYPNLRTLEPNIRAFAAAGVEGVFFQTSSKDAVEFSELRHYVAASLLWDPTRSAGQLVNEFLALHYGNAAPAILQFTNLVHNHYADTNLHHSVFIPGMQKFPVDKSVAATGLKLMRRALDLAENETVKARVEKASIWAYRAAIDPIWKLKKDAAIDPALGRQMRPLVKEFFRLYGTYRLRGYVAGPRERIEGILANQGAKPALKLPLLPISKDWRFTTDLEKQGERKQYFKTDFDDSDWTVLKEYDFWAPPYLGVGWYRQTINPPADIADKKHLYLFFGAVDEEAFVYINGKYAFERSVKSTGQSPGMLWNQPFLHDVKGLIRPGRPNVIAVKVHNTSQSGEIWIPVYLFPTDEEWTAQAISDSL